jgi:hypothetical protein
MSRIELCTNWWGGLGDCILYLSAANAYSIRNNTSLNIGACNDPIEKKMKDLIEIYKPYNDLKFNFIHREEFAPDGKEDYTKYQIYGNDNYDRSVREKHHIPKRQIYGTYSILRASGKLNVLPDFDVQYLKFKVKEPRTKMYATIQLNGRSCGPMDYYRLKVQDFKNLFLEFTDYCDFYILTDNDTDNLQTQFKSFNNVKITDTRKIGLIDVFDLINNACCHVGVDSGLPHVAMSCTVPYIAIKKIYEQCPGLVSCVNDSVISPLDRIEDLYLYLYKTIVHNIPKE